MVERLDDAGFNQNVSHKSDKIYLGTGGNQGKWSFVETERSTGNIGSVPAFDLLFLASLVA